ncbi:MAG: flagellar type III secretion system pore protein FliP [Gammaproteobacteria bacterium]|nr:flagellar type III secretion system pore protein FliP [Gammaproteobacteria bacterium]
MKFIFVIALFLISATSFAAPGLEALTVETTIDGDQKYSLSLQALVLMTALSLLPAALLMMTSFTRIIIVLAILRQALGTAQTPSNQILLGLALFITVFIMSPVLQEINVTAAQPYYAEDISADQAINLAKKPIMEFMLAQTREDDISMFIEMSGIQGIDGPENIPLTVLLPSFVTSELKTAFQIGFLIFLPFLIIDLVVASVLMSMGMMMLSPLIISLPFKLMLFVMVDGWSMIIGSLASSFL